MNPNPTFGVLLVLGAATPWGTTGTAQSLAGGALSAHWFGALRLATANAFFALCALASRARAGAPFTGRLAARDVLGAGLCFSYAAYTLLNQRMARAAPASTITFRAVGVAAAIAVPTAWMTAGAPTVTGAGLAAVASTGIVTAGVPYLLFSVALRHITPARGVTLASCEPVVAFALSVGVLGEMPESPAYLGLLPVVCGVPCVVRQELANHRRSSHSADGRVRAHAPATKVAGATPTV